MINKLILFFTLLTTFAIASNNISFADDFNFTVPVQVQNLLPEVRSILVHCYALRESNLIVGESENVYVNIPNTGNKVKRAWERKLKA